MSLSLLSSRPCVSRTACGFALLALVTLAGLACESTRPIDPPDPASVASISISPTTIPIVKGSTQSFTILALDTTGTAVKLGADWSSTAPSVATVSNDGAVTGIGYGTTTITATIGTHSATAEVVVTAVPTARSYSVLDLGADAKLTTLTRRQLSDSGDVLADPGPTLYHEGIATSLSPCVAGLAINGPGDVLCKVNALDSVSSYAIWHDGALTPLAAADTFKAEHFRAFALNDSGEVAGLFFMPTFANANCPATGVRCLSLWKNGVANFPGFNAASEVMLMNGEQQIVLEDPMYQHTTTFFATIYDPSTNQQRSVPWGVQALNDNGWAAIRKDSLRHAPTDFISFAVLAMPDSIVRFGSGGATGINDANVVVGTLEVGPFIWRGAGVSLLTDAATDPAWTITGADEINNRGQILATADNTDGRKAHVVILTPVQQ